MENSISTRYYFRGSQPPPKKLPRQFNDLPRKSSSCLKLHEVAEEMLRVVLSKRNPRQQTIRIRIAKRVPYSVVIPVRSSYNPVRVRLKVPANSRVIAPMKILIQPRLRICVLPGEP